MKGLIKKVRENKKGFTLAELLVVVAIVGILVAISIPVFTAQLSKARKATNQANLRAAKAAAVAQYMTDEMEKNATDEVIYNYDLATGTVAVSYTHLTGFANSVASPALEYKAEGQVFGVGCKIFTIAGPVILYGILSSWGLGVVYWGWMMLTQ